MSNGNDGVVGVGVRVHVDCVLPYDVVKKQNHIAWHQWQQAMPIKGKGSEQKEMETWLRTVLPNHQITARNWTRASPKARRSKVSSVFLSASKSTHAGNPSAPAFSHYFHNLRLHLSPLQGFQPEWRTPCPVFADTLSPLEGELLPVNIFSSMKTFLTELLLYSSLMSITDVIYQCVLGVHDHRLLKTAERIRDHGLQTFCILIAIGHVDQIINFLAHNAMDDRLPIRTVGELCTIAPDLDHERFMAVQWQFVPWVFKPHSIHVILSDDIVLPFLEEELIAEGTRGSVRKISIPETLQQILGSECSEETITLVRKVIKSKKLTKITKYPYQDEVECLELYHSLQHPNIILFLGSYTLGDQHFLLFPFYPMDLNTFMRQEVTFGEFRDISIFTAALVGLASALQSVHELNRRCNLTPAFLTRYGYHHDIRPANILVTPKSFVLADFGLARPTLPDQECSTIWIKNIGHYVAPECMTPELKPQQVGRSYDIWAFGCLITELATYMERGANGVSEFRSQRTTPYFHALPFVNGYFFHGNSLKDEVSRWLSDLTREPCFRVTSSLVAFSMHILQDDHCRRPDIGICVTCLSYIHAKQSFHTACSLLEELLLTLSQYSKVVSAHTATELQMELSKLKAFGAVLHMDDDAVFDFELFSSQMFAKLVSDRLISNCDKLRQSRDTLGDHKKAWLMSQSNLGSIGQSMVHIIDESFRQQVRELCESLLAPEQRYLDSLWRKYLLDDCNRRSSLEAVQYSVNTMPRLFNPMSLHIKIERLEQALRRQIDVTNSSDRNLILDWSVVQPVRSFSRSHSLGVYNKSQVQAEDFTFAQPKQEMVLIEWIFISQMNEEESPDDRIGKILILAGLLNCPKPTSFRVLDCAGVIPPNKIDDPRYGFVYTLPPEADTVDSREPVTLRQILSDDKLRISLDDRFNISKALSSSVFELHCHGWLHKNITSDNIIFFFQNEENKKAPASSSILDVGPYLIGFHHSRPESEIFYSDINSAENNIANLFYQHPAYEYSKNRFTKVDDYYSLGIVLLEIGFWRTCRDIWENHQNGRYKSLDRKVFKEKLVEKFVPGLAAVMGTAYRNAVSICLRWAFNADGNERTFSQDTDSQFFRQVVQRLEACYVG